jgi:hypothetical protein
MADTLSPRSETESSRATNVLYLMPPDAARLAQLVLPALASTTESKSAGLRALVLTEDEETAVGVARHAAREIGGGLAPIVALTSPARAKRVLQSAIPGAAVMPTRVAAALIAQSALPLGELRQIIVTMPTHAEAAGFGEVLGGIMSEIPKNATRLLVAARETPDVEMIVERHFFKARHVRDAGESVPSHARGRIQILPATSGTRWDALRRLIDQLDPPAAAVMAVDAATFSEGQHELATLGYSAEGPVVVTRDTPEPGTHLVVLMGAPDAATLQRAAGADPAYLVVMCAPSEVVNVRSIAGPMTIQPITLDGPRSKAATREATTRARLREILASGEFARELAAITPLFDDFDASEVAAAALVLASEATRQPPAAAPVPTVPSGPPAVRSAPREERPERSDRGDRPPRPSRSDGERTFSRPRDDRGGPPRDARRGPGRDDRRPPRDDRGGPPRGDRSGPPRGERSGPPRGDRTGASRSDYRSGPRNDSRGPSRNDDPRKSPRKFDDRKSRPGR